MSLIDTNREQPTFSEPSRFHQPSPPRVWARCCWRTGGWGEFYLLTCPAPPYDITTLRHQADSKTLLSQSNRHFTRKKDSHFALQKKNNSGKTWWMMGNHIQCSPFSPKSIHTLKIISKWCFFFLNKLIFPPEKCAQKHGGNKDGSQKKNVKIQNMKTYWKKNPLKLNYKHLLFILIFK